MNFLVLAHPGDELALRVYLTLRARHGAVQAKLVSADELALAVKWSHAIDTDGITSEVVLHDGTVLDLFGIGAVFNRLQFTPMPHFAGSRAADREYAMMEMHALWLSWLSSLPCPVINKATPRGIGAPEFGEVEWLWLAGRAGLPVRGYHLSTNPRLFSSPGFVAFQPLDARGGLNHRSAVDRIILGQKPALFLEPLSGEAQQMIVVGDTVLGALAGLYGDKLRSLARAVNCELLQVNFQRAEVNGAGSLGEWKASYLTAFVNVHDRPVVDAVVSLLENYAENGGGVST